MLHATCMWVRAMVTSYLSTAPSVAIVVRMGWACRIASLPSSACTATPRFVSGISSN